MYEVAGESAVVLGPESVETREFELPPPDADGAILEVELTGVCGSDPKTYLGKYRPEVLPAVLGHEILGRIVAIGEDAVDSFGVSEGDRVVVEAGRRCGTCRHCLRGDYQYCSGIEHRYGYTPVDVPPGAWGGHGKYMALGPGTVVHRISDAVPSEAGALACAVVGNSIRWLQSGGDELVGSSLVVQGPGPQGLSMTVVAARAGLSPIVVTGVPGDEERLAMAEDLGADVTVCASPDDLVARTRAVLDGEGFDVVVNATGVAGTVQQSIDLVGIRGTVVYPNVTGGDTSTVAFDELVHKDVRLQGVFSRTASYVDRAIEVIESDPSPFARLVSDTFPVDRAEGAYRLAGGLTDDPLPIKVAIDPAQ